MCPGGPGVSEGSRLIACVCVCQRPGAHMPHEASGEEGQRWSSTQTALEPGRRSGQRAMGLILP